MKARLTEERGVVLVVVSAVLLALMLLSLAVAGEATHSSTYSVQDRNQKVALAAAQAGLQVATYRLNKLHPDSSHCVTSQLALPNDPSGDCVWTQSLGNGASFTYYMTTGGASCASIPGVTDTTGTERCITVSGTSNGQTRRIQERSVQTQATPPLLPVGGIFGLNAIDIGNNAHVTADVGSNGAISFGGGTTDISGQVQLGPGGTYSGPAPGGGQASHSTFTLQTPPIAGTELPCSPNPSPCNNNAALASFSGYSALDRSLSLGSSTLTLPSGDYNFCRLDFGSGDIEVQPGASVRIFVDAPASVRPGSLCPENPQLNGIPYGTTAGWNGLQLNVNGQPSQMQFFIYGWDPNGAYAAVHGQNAVTISKNNMTANALFYAPNTIMDTGKNNLTLHGGLAANEVHVKNNLDFAWDSAFTDTGSTSGTAEREGWFECRPKATVAGNPQSGC